MSAAIIAAAFLIGFLSGWALIPILAIVGLIVFGARGHHGVIIALSVIAAVVGVLRSQDARDHALDNSWLPQSEITGQIADAVADDGRTQRFALRIDADHQLCVRTFSRADLGRGDRITAEIDADAAGSLSPGYAAFLRAKRCNWSATIVNVTILRSGTGLTRTLDGIRGDVATKLVGWAPGDSGALLAGIVVGDDSMLSDETMDAFQRTGTLHVVAISGSNLTLLVSLLLIASLWSRRRGFTDVLALLAIWGYVLVGGAGPPTLRAGFLATAAAGARALGRPADLLTLSLQVAAVQAFIWPSSVLGLSYQLSTAAIFGVLMAASGRSFSGVRGAVKLVVLTTLVVNLVLLPILPEQSRPSILLSLLTNTLIAPLISLAFVLGLLAVVLTVLHPVLGESLAVMAAEVNGLTIRIVRSIAEWHGLPGPIVWDGSDVPTAVLFGGAIVVLLGMSTEFRRATRDLQKRAIGIDERTGMLVFGSGLGACVGVLIVSIVR
jgi:ComEC/Rec2-related protein